MSCSMRQRINIVLIGTAVLLAVSIGYRHAISDAGDSYKCASLQEAGKWLGRPISSYTSDDNLYWQPRGCLLHNYNANDIESCLQCKRLLFVGDSTVRQVYWATVRKLDSQRAAEMTLSAAKHGNLNFQQGCAEIEFVWDQFLNSTTLKEEVEQYQSGTELSSSTRIAAVLMGTGLWQAKDLGPMYLDSFKRSVDSVRVLVPQNARDSNGVLLPPNGRAGAHSLVVFAPVPLPVQSQLDPTRAATMTPERIHAMNDYLRSSVDENSIEVLWSYYLMTWQRPSAYKKDGYHIVESVADRQADVLLNMRCNSEPSLQRHPFDKTCCNLQPLVNREQQLLILIAAATSLFALYESMKTHLRNESGLSILPTNDVIRAAGVLAIAILYCFVADRTLIFDRVQKVPNQATFWQLTAAVMLGGILTVRRSGKRSIDKSGKAARSASVPTFLSRDQTDEWKGWMQFVILIYHYTGMSSVLWIYQIIRLLVASYLFMTGFGHTIYFLKTNNFSLHRVASVLIRLNLLSCLLAYLMRTNYNFYYFPALSSFWFLVVFLTVRIRHQPSAIPRLLTLKILLSAACIQLLLRTPGLLELIFDFLQMTCKMQLDVQELRFRLSLDAYIVYAGMFAGGLYLQIVGGLPCSTTCLATQIKRVPIVFQVFTVIASVVVLPAYLIVIRRFPDKNDYNWWHPMISPLPVLAFVVLRNATDTLRDVHSRLFAWFGQFSLETFILQYHIWLAADTKALLSLGLWTRDSAAGDTWSDKIRLSSEFVLVTLMFLWTSWAASNATNVVTSIILNDHRETGSFKFLDTLRWWSPSKDAGRKRVSPLLAAHAGYRSTPSEDIQGEKEDLKAPILTNQGDLATRESYGLILRLGLMLLLMWIGNWVYS